MRMKEVDEGVQKAWNMMSMHNSELLLENYELKERINKLEAQLFYTQQVLQSGGSHSCRVTHSQDNRERRDQRAHRHGTQLYAI